MVERPVCALEAGVVGNLLGEHVARDAEAERGRLVVEGRVADQPAENLAGKAEKLCLLLGDRLLELLTESGVWPVRTRD